MATVFNSEFRDKAAQSAFPFTSDSLMSYGKLVIDTACFLDASIYPLEMHKAPYFISELDIAGEENKWLKVTITDSDNVEVGTVICDPTTNSAVVQDKYDSVIGVLVYTPEKIVDLVSALNRTRLTLAENTLRFTAGVCYSVESEGNMMFAVGNEKFQDHVLIVAAGGVHFELETIYNPYESSSSSSTDSSSQSTGSPSSQSDISSTSVSSGLTSASSSSSPSSSSTSSESSSEAPYSTLSSSSSSESTSSSSESSRWLYLSSESSSSSSDSSSHSSESSPSSTSISSSSESSESSTSESSLSSSSLSSLSSQSSWENRYGTVSVNLYGEMYTLNPPIVSINKRKMDNVWLAAHPDSSIRVVTDSNERIIIGKAKEFDNG